MVPVVFVGNISAEATTPAGNIFAEAMRGECINSELQRAYARSVKVSAAQGHCTL
jgi:hypothetical protein